MFIYPPIETIIHSVILGVLMWFFGFPDGESVASGYFIGHFIVAMVYTRVKYKDDPEYKFIQSTHFFLYIAEACAYAIGGLFVAAALEGILN